MIDRSSHRRLLACESPTPVRVGQMSCSASQLLAPLKLVWDSPAMLRLLPIMLYWSHTVGGLCDNVFEFAASSPVSRSCYPSTTRSRRSSGLQMGFIWGDFTTYYAIPALGDKNMPLVRACHDSTPHPSPHHDSTPYPSPHHDSTPHPSPHHDSRRAGDGGVRPH